MPKSGVISDLVHELRKKANIDDDPARPIRVNAVNNGRIYKELGPDYPVTSIVDYYTLYAERVPEEELQRSENDKLMSCYHCDKDVSKYHGIPFKFVVKPVSISDLCAFFHSIG